MPRLIGVDFDNTLVTYDDLIHSVAVERGLVQLGIGKSKRLIRDAIRLLPDGEVEWQKVQATVYGPRMTEARPAEGTRKFLGVCASNEIEVRIISHKTQFANYDETGTDLRQTAISWIQQYGFFNHADTGLSEKDVFFASSRQQKLEQISKSGCSHFIDDLEETFLEEFFPAEVKGILYAPNPVAPLPPGVILAGDWQRITDYLFPDAKD